MNPKIPNANKQGSYLGVLLLSKVLLGRVVIMMKAWMETMGQKILWLSIPLTHWLLR